MRKRSVVALAASVLGMMCVAADAPKTFKPDSEGFIQNWVILDPIAIKTTEHEEAVEKPVFVKEYFKDQMKAEPKAGDKVTVEGKELVWRAASTTSFDLDLVQFAADHNKASDAVLFLGVAYVVAPEEVKDVKLSIGSDDSSMWWVNDKQVIAVYAGRGVGQDDDSSKPLTLKKGLNVVRFAVINGDGPGGFCARFVDSKERPVKDLTILAAPSEIKAENK